ncbi:MAG: TlpA family protein disulfide reductase [Solirubrobacteraceae bacterium]|nr:TlpA family protein disulfide reductase [Solirubrobacteraceae bacterium]
MRPATDTIHCPPFPRGLPWINTEQLRIDKQLGRPLVIAFWDSRRAVSIRPLLALERWHREFGPRGARVIAVHVDGDGAGTPEADVRRAAERLGLTMPIVIDEELQIASGYGLQGVPSRYIFDQGLKLVDAHFGLGGLADGEHLLLALVEHSERSLAERRAQGEAAAAPMAATPATEPEEDESCDQGAAVPAAKQPRLIVRPPTADALPEPIIETDQYVAPEPAEVLPGDFRDAYAAGAVWLELRGEGTATLGDHVVHADGDGTYLFVDHGLDAPGTLTDLALTDGLTCRSVQLEPGIAAAE